KAAKSLEESHAVMLTAPPSPDYDIVAMINESRWPSGFRVPDPQPAFPCRSLAALTMGDAGQAALGVVGVDRLGERARERMTAGDRITLLVIGEGMDCLAERRRGGGGRVRRRRLGLAVL